MNTDEKSGSTESEDSECRNEVSQEINNDSSVGLDVDPFQRLKRHFSSLNNQSVSVSEENSRIAVDFPDESSFNTTLAAAKTCLENEECTKETAYHFYSQIRSVAEHISYIKEQNDGSIHEVDRINFGLMDFTQKALDDCDKIKTILTLSYSEKVWNHLTESQKAGIESFKKLFSESYEQLIGDRVLYEDTNIPVTSIASSNPSEKASFISLKSKEHQELLTEKNKLLSELAMVEEKHAKLQEASTEIEVASPHCQYQARLIAMLSPFLYVHRLSGQSVAEISSYFKSLGYHTNEQVIENILGSFPSLFREFQSSEGHSEEKRWTFCGCDF